MAPADIMDRVHNESRIQAREEKKIAHNII